MAQSAALRIDTTAITATQPRIHIVPAADADSGVGLSRGAQGPRLPKKPVIVTVPYRVPLPTGWCRPPCIFFGPMRVCPQPKNYLGHDQQIGRPRYLAAYVFDDGRHHVTIGL